VCVRECWCRGRRPTIKTFARSLNPSCECSIRSAYHLFERLSLQYLFYPSSFLLLYDKWFRESDVIQLFNTHDNYFAHTALPFISRKKPVVWRLSDMWAMTGHCTHALDCERWMSGCGSCPYLSGYPALRWDTTAFSLAGQKKRLCAITDQHCGTFKVDCESRAMQSPAEPLYHPSHSQRHRHLCLQSDREI